MSARFHAPSSSARFGPSLPIAKGLTTRLEEPAPAGYEAPPPSSAWRRAILAGLSGFLLSFGAVVCGTILLERAPAPAIAAPETKPAGFPPSSIPAPAAPKSVWAIAPAPAPAFAAAASPATAIASAEIVFAIADLRPNWRAWSGKTIAVEGVVTIGEGGFVPHRNQFVMQDETGGLVVDDPDGRGGRRAPTAGERARVTGKLAEYRGALQLVPVGPIEFLGAAQPPSALPVRPSDFCEALEGMLLRVEGARAAWGGPTDASGANANLDLLLPDGQAVRLFLDADAKIPELQLPPTFAAQGILYPYMGPDAGAPGAPAWTLYPRGAGDFDPR